MREPWHELMFADCDKQAKHTRDPAAPAKRCDAAMKKVTSLLLDDGTPAHSLHSLMQDPLNDYAQYLPHTQQRP